MCGRSTTSTLVQLEYIFINLIIIKCLTLRFDLEDDPQGHRFWSYRIWIVELTLERYFIHLNCALNCFQFIIIYLIILILKRGGCHGNHAITFLSYHAGKVIMDFHDPQMTPFPKMYDNLGSERNPLWQKCWSCVVV